LQIRQTQVEGQLAEVARGNEEAGPFGAQGKLKPGLCKGK